MRLGRAKRKTAWAPAFALLPALLCATGCYTTRAVRKTLVAGNLLDSSLDQLTAAMRARYESVQTMNVSVRLTATTGGTHKGKETELEPLDGYIFLRKPADLRVLLLAPVFRSRAVDMSSDGTTFKLLITLPHTRAVTGLEASAPTSKNGLENLRPALIRDALLIPPPAPDQFVTLTQDTRLLNTGKGKDAVEEPDYVVTVLRPRTDDRSGHTLERVRSVHISRATLLPYRQDIYDASGRVVTTVSYDGWTKIDGQDYPKSLLIARPLDEYTLRIDITKLALNTKLDDEQFALKLPEGIPVQTMN